LSCVLETDIAIDDTVEIVDLALGGRGTFEIEKRALAIIYISEFKSRNINQEVISLDILSFSIIDLNVTKAHRAIHYFHVYLDYKLQIFANLYTVFPEATAATSRVCMSIELLVFRPVDSHRLLFRLTTTCGFK
jgi:hypothetical protein